MEAYKVPEVQPDCLAAPRELKRLYGFAYSLLVMAEMDKFESNDKFFPTLFPHFQNETIYKDNNRPVMGQ